MPRVLTFLISERNTMNVAIWGTPTKATRLGIEHMSEKRRTEFRGYLFTAIKKFFDAGATPSMDYHEPTIDGPSVMIEAESSSQFLIELVALNPKGNVHVEDSVTGMIEAALAGTAYEAYMTNLDQGSPPDMALSLTLLEFPEVLSV